MRGPVIFIRAILVFVLFLSACTSNSTRLLGDGSIDHHIKCESVLFGLGDCFARAADTCGPAGYQVINGQGEPVPVEASDNPSKGADPSAVTSSFENVSGGFTPSSQELHSSGLFVRCNREPTPIKVTN